MTLRSAWKKLRQSIARRLLKNPFDVAHYLCVGNGLEVGAMSSPYPFGGRCVVEYADIHDETTLKNIIDKIPLPNLYRGKFVKATYQLKAPRYGLDMIKSNSLDFVFSSHSLEHTPNPIWALIDQLRVCRPGGVVYAVIPNKRFTYDCHRNATSVETLIKKYRDQDFQHTIEQALDIVLNTIDHPLYKDNRHRAQEYARQIIKDGEGIHHFYVFDEVNTLEMLKFVSDATTAKIEYFSSAELGDIRFALRR